MPSLFFTNEKICRERLNGLPKASELIHGKAEINPGPQILNSTNSMSILLNDLISVCWF